MSQADDMSPPAPATVLLLARSAITAPPLKEMERLRAALAPRPGVHEALFAFSEQGSPSLRHALDKLVAAGCDRLVILPMLIPAEPNFQAWLTRTLTRWRSRDERPWPAIEIATLLPNETSLISLLDLALAAERTELSLGSAKVSPEGSLVPAQKRRVLACMGGPCNVAGAEVIWGHLRNEQDRLSLRTSGDGCMSAKTSCLGPCNLAPVVQVWPEGTNYGGVDEAAVDRIIAEHILGGCPVADLAYEPTGKKQFLRARKA
ncbi:NADH:ubiquinone oxidoreductase subunit (Chain E) [Bosea sp. 62]|uniref:(2Fe-2S) ferredoxin domain-containing protein n=1 Tax=unclassified Bosea (in: a-proteobacteria) TaxID=2653178 RepID=UPI0012547647|nr:MULTISPECIES: (2Fe-2S) ferredoxin domain-containing protein [unclassified Bosea (in: a-proteobacteria)]CAD5256895.1 NADH:ubiquinone oxidoreductase subunit (Chain E) [Bosea sp. 7B]CAD5273411.1 NADH:ubiquinone oxidoreductase subunit (Chain E) [Bosea sp. 21B]CAD5284671.1 NADH:ubiquinone oxidoreductase subunit (Chain E) [Bosea sp. 46]VVT60207.1 NADH:ubiquinone oxidoreductase subunit (Chain E) [Bosea sp. EC-HK365B]VXB59226.1 NADH:ubiquinone oxidoreductase subunit (Chain E) [Bosea sp. 62]